jgi:hypothetical protein
MKLRILTVAAAGVMALGLSACQQKTEEAPAAPAADASATAPAEAMPAAPPADAAAPADPAAAPPADTGAMSSTMPPAEPEKK